MMRPISAIIPRNTAIAMDTLPKVMQQIDVSNLAITAGTTFCVINVVGLERTLTHCVELSAVIGAGSALMANASAPRGDNRLTWAIRPTSWVAIQQKNVAEKTTEATPQSKVINVGVGC